MEEKGALEVNIEELKEKIKEFLNSLPEKNKQQAKEKLKSKFPNLDKQKLKEYKSITN